MAIERGARPGVRPGLPPLNEKGFTVFVVRHGSRPRYPLSSVVADMRRSVRFIHQHAKEYGVDPNRIGVFGNSSGGHLALLLGTTFDSGNPSASDPVLRESSRVAAVVANYPATDLARLAMQQPILNITAAEAAVGTHAGPPVLSADGQRLAFVASSPEGRTVLGVRSLGSLQAQRLAGTEGATFPFWSPDGDQLGFFADRKLKKVSLAGGAVTTLCETAVAAGGAWSRDNIIVFARDLNGALHRVSANGGTAIPATVLNRERREANHRWPVFLRDGRRFLYAVGKRPATAREWLSRAAVSRRGPGQGTGLGARWDSAFVERPAETGLHGHSDHRCAREPRV